MKSIARLQLSNRVLLRMLRKDSGEDIPDTAQIFFTDADGNDHKVDEIVVSWTEETSE